MYPVSEIEEKSKHPVFLYSYTTTDLQAQCEPGRPCGQCIRLSLKHQRIACIKTRIIEIAFFRQGMA